LSRVSKEAPIYSIENSPTALTQSVLLNVVFDGAMTVVFSDKDLEVRADFIPPVGNGAPLGPEMAALPAQGAPLIQNKTMGTTFLYQFVVMGNICQYET
jgi:hypothetical protein